MDNASSQAGRLAAVMLILFGPLAVPVATNEMHLSHGSLSKPPIIAAMIAAALVVSLSATFAIERPRMPPRLRQAIWGNVAFIVFDAAIFLLLANGQQPDSETYPLIWISLAGMHLCYVLILSAFRWRALSI